MNWASEETPESPKLNQLAVAKDGIGDHTYFKELIGLYNLTIIYEEQEYYILDGSPEDLDEFQRDWNFNG